MPLRTSPRGPSPVGLGSLTTWQPQHRGTSYVVASTPKVRVPKDLGRVVWPPLPSKLVYHLLLRSRFRDGHSLHSSSGRELRSRHTRTHWPEDSVAIFGKYSLPQKCDCPLRKSHTTYLSMCVESLRLLAEVPSRAIEECHFR